MRCLHVQPVHQVVSAPVNHDHLPKVLFVFQLCQLQTQNRNHELATLHEIHGSLKSLPLS